MVGCQSLLSILYPMAATYFWPPDDTSARAVSLAAWGVSGLILPLWTNPEIWEFSGSFSVSAAISGTYGFSSAVLR